MKITVLFLIPIKFVPMVTAMNHANFGPFQCCWLSVHKAAFLTCLRRECCVQNWDIHGLGVHFESQLLKCRLKPQGVG